MGSEPEPEPSSITKLRLFTTLHIQSPEHPGSPLRTSASVPFRWEEEPGKPRPCTALSILHPNRSLELPPRLQSLDSKMTIMPSPTTVLDDGPYLGTMPTSRSSSFRLASESQGHFGHFKDSDTVLSKRGEKREIRGFLFGSNWGRKLTLKSSSSSTGGDEKEVGGEGSSVFSHSMDLVLFDGDESEDTRVKMSRIRRKGSFSSLSQVRSQFWATVYEGFKHLLPWKSRKSKKNSLIV